MMERESPNHALINLVARELVFMVVVMEIPFTERLQCNEGTI